MAATKKILTSLHGKLIGLSHDFKLVIGGKTVPTQDDTGVLPVIQGTPGALNATGTLTAALIASKLVTSTSAAAVVATLDTGALMDDTFTNVAVGEGIEWGVINTGVSNFVVTASAGHTLIGNIVVAPKSQGRFFSRRTAADTWVTYAVGFGSNVESVGTPGALDATGTLTAALIAGKIVTSSTAAAVTATVDTGTAMDTALAAVVPVGTGIIWSAINTGGANAFTVTAAADHTLVGAGAVAASTSGRFFSKRTAANTWISYRLS